MSTNKNSSIYEAFANPKIIGEGSWYTFHRMAAKAELSGKRSDKEFVADFFTYYCETMMCSDCHGHCTKHVTSNPPSVLIDIPYGLFDWTVNFRNAVAIRVGGPTYDLMTMRDIFFPKADTKAFVCTKSCGKKSVQKEEKKTSKPRTTQHNAVNAGKYTTTGNSNIILLELNSQNSNKYKKILPSVFVDN